MNTFLDHLDRVADDAVAVIDESGTLTYGRLRDRAQRIAGLLHERHGGGNYLLLPATSDAGFVATLLGVAYSGNTPVPIDPDLPAPSVEYIQRKSHAVATLSPHSDDDLNKAEPADYRDANVPMMILFTSGTTGYPKGVIISHANLLHSCQAISNYLNYPTYRSAAVALPLHYSYALLSQVCCMLSVGGRMRLFPELRNPLKFADQVNTLQLETFCGVPSTYYSLSLIHAMRPLKMPSVRVLCSAGAAMDQSRYETVKEMFPNAVFFNNYGMTEAAPRISYIRDDDPRFHQPTCGRPMDGVEVRIVNPQSHRPVPEGETGVLVVRGPNVTSGYLNDPDITAKSFTEEGYLISGDLASMQDGYIYIHGRLDDIFNVGGEKVAPLEIERALNQHPQVELSAVCGLADEQRGKVPVAFVRLRAPTERRELVAYLERWLPQVKVPLRYFEVRDFPMTPNGKIQRHRLSPDDTERVIGEIV